MIRIVRLLVQRILPAAALCASVFAADRAFACGFDLSGFFPNDYNIVLEAKTWREPGGVPTGTITVTGTRGVVSSGVASYSAQVSSDMQFYSARLMYGDDANSNGVIDSGEWTVVSAASAAWNGTNWVATTTPTNVSVSHGAYRIEHVWADGTYYDEIKDCNLN